MSKPILPANCWVLSNFPDLDPASIIRNRDVERQQLNWREYERAVWIWYRRPPEMNWMKLFPVLGVAALAHFPLILLADPLIFCICHLFYIGIVTACVGCFMGKEAKFRRWKQDYLRSLARLIESPDPPAG